MIYSTSVIFYASDWVHSSDSQLIHASCDTFHLCDSLYTSNLLFYSDSFHSDEYLIHYILVIYYTPIIHFTLMIYCAPVIHLTLMIYYTPVIHYTLMIYYTPVIHSTLAIYYTPVIHSTLMIYYTPIIHYTLVIYCTPVIHCTLIIIFFSIDSLYSNLLYYSNSPYPDDLLFTLSL